MLSNAEADKVRSELSQTRERIDEIACEIKKADYEIARVRDEIGEENDIRSSKGENQAFYDAVSRSIAKLEWELGKYYAVRTEFIAKSKKLRARRDTLHRKLEEG
jgi:uncharacterized coiled-coil DUF342 family protein